MKEFSLRIYENIMRIQPIDNHHPTTGVTKPEGNDEDFIQSLNHYYTAP